MLLFCPMCSNMLVVSSIPIGQLAATDEADSGANRFQCRTCPYQMVLKRKFFERKPMDFKPASDVLGGAASWANVDKARVQCPASKCNSDEAFFRQIQIRSADEPMTIFYRCTVCLNEWRE